MALYYQLAPDMSIMHLKDGSIVFKSDTLSIKLEGESAKFLVNEVFPLMRENKTVDEMADQLPSVSTTDLQANLDQLTNAGVLLKSNAPFTNQENNNMPGYYRNFLTRVGINASNADEIFAKSKIAVLGLEGHGTHLVLDLLESGFTNLVLLDPFLADKDFFASFPILPPSPDGRSRQELVCDYLQKLRPRGHFSTGPDEITKESLEKTVADCHLLIVCFDIGFSSVFYWANQVSLSRNIPVLYSTVKGSKSFVGPLVLPEKTPCYMCYKMRSVATQENFEEAMGYEEYLNQLKLPSLKNRIVLPAALHFTAATLTSEALQYFLSIGHLSLAGKVLEFDSLNLNSKMHSVLHKPDCPVCQKKTFERTHLPARELDESLRAEKLDAMQELLVSNHTGVVKSLQAVLKDFSEPELPIVYGAELANHSFFPKGERTQLNCSGKGMNKSSAVTSALGEAMERYSATWIREGEVEYKSFNEFERGEALDPGELVLYLDHQYPDLPFARFDNSQPIGWVKAYSLLKEKNIYIPAQPTFLNYTLQYPREYIGQATSNGLAAGPTLVEAILSAALEVIERDIFLIAWHNKFPCDPVDPLTHPDQDMVDYCSAYERRGVKLKLFRLPTDAPCSVFMAIGVQEKGEGPAIVVGLGADFSSTVAARQALLEVGQIRPSFKQRLRKEETKKRKQELIEDPQKVEDLEDHDLLYATKDHIAAFDFLFQRPVTTMNWDEKKRNPAENLAALLGFLGRIQSDLIYFNLTPPDMRNLNIHTVRAVLPGFQPIHFGSKNIRLAGRRLYELGQTLGFSLEKSHWSGLNPYPHPLA